MMDLFKKELADTVEIDGTEYRIQTSFRYGILFHRLVNNPETKTQEMIDTFYPYQKPIDTKKAINALVSFYTEKAPLPRFTVGTVSDDLAFDYDLDADYIYAAFMEQYGINLVKSEMHWYEFRALFNSLHNTRLNEIIEMRLYEGEEKCGEREYEQKRWQLKEAWRIERKADEEDEDLKKFNEIFG